MLSTNPIWLFFFVIQCLFLCSIITLTISNCTRKARNRCRRRRQNAKQLSSSKENEHSLKGLRKKSESRRVSNPSNDETIVTDSTQVESDVTQLSYAVSNVVQEASSASHSYDVLRFGWIRRRNHKGSRNLSLSRDSISLDKNDTVTPISCSSSEDGFFDAPTGEEKLIEKLGTPKSAILAHRKSPDSVSAPPSQVKITLEKRPDWESTEEEPDWGDEHENFDQIYENYEDPGDTQNGETPQGGFTMDLTKVPTHLLERRSLLEMYSDFFAHPDDFVKGMLSEDPEERMIGVVKYYLGTFYPPRKSGVAKKPYNPILGETFRCRWNVPGVRPSNKLTTTGPFPGSDFNQVTFVAEQVSHHPPISAFYAEHPGKKISLEAYIWTKSFFLGLSIGVANIGHAIITLHDYDEKYVMTFPNAYLRSIVASPWVELGGKCEIRCEKTGYYADIEFLTKPFFGGKPHKITGSIYKDGVKKPIQTFKGDWNDVITCKPNRGEEYVLVDVKAKPEVAKECEPVANQAARESRKLWRHVTCALFRNRITIASSAKRWIENRQREEAKKRNEMGQEYHPKLFFKVDGDKWRYKYPLESRKKP